MALHDELARKAAAMGKTAREFSAAAQKHANATWFYLILGAGVWYFFDWVWALIPGALAAYSAFQSVSATLVADRLERKESNAGSSELDFLEVVSAYGKTLATEAPTPGTVADVKKLPYPKQVIKDAIVTALRRTPESDLKEKLKVGYLSLSNWQEGVGEANQGLDVLRMDMNQDVESLAEAVLEQSSGSEVWIDKWQKEQAALKRELQELGLW